PLRTFGGAMPDGVTFASKDRDPALRLPPRAEERGGAPRAYRPPASRARARSRAPFVRRARTGGVDRNDRPSEASAPAFRHRGMGLDPYHRAASGQGPVPLLRSPGERGRREMPVVRRAALSGARFLRTEAR